VSDVARRLLGHERRAKVLVQALRPLGSQLEFLFGGQSVGQLHLIRSRQHEPAQPAGQPHRQPRLAVSLVPARTRLAVESVSQCVQFGAHSHQGHRTHSRLRLDRVPRQLPLDVGSQQRHLQRKARCVRLHPHFQGLRPTRRVRVRLCHTSRRRTSLDLEPQRRKHLHHLPESRLERFIQNPHPPDRREHPNRFDQREQCRIPWRVAQSRFRQLQSKLDCQPS